MTSDEFASSIDGAGRSMPKMADLQSLEASLQSQLPGDTLAAVSVALGPQGGMDPWCSIGVARRHVHILLAPRMEPGLRHAQNAGHHGDGERPGSRS